MHQRGERSASSFSPTGRLDPVPRLAGGGGEGHLHPPSPSGKLSSRTIPLCTSLPSVSVFILQNNGPYVPGARGRLHGRWDARCAAGTQERNPKGEGWNPAYVEISPFFRSLFWMSANNTFLSPPPKTSAVVWCLFFALLNSPGEVVTPRKLSGEVESFQVV